MRALSPVSHSVSDSQILDVKTAAPPLRLVKPAPPRRQVPTLNDLVSLNFFASGLTGEETGTYSETEHVPIQSLDEVPHSSGPMVVALSLLTVAVGAGAWWLSAGAFAMLGLVL